MPDYTPEQIQDMYWGPVGPDGRRHGRPQPTPIPAAGDLLLYRPRRGEAPISARVLEADVTDRADANVWWPEGALRRDPAPLITVEYEQPHPKGGTELQTVRCREARVSGEAGWLWPDDPASLTAPQGQAAPAKAAGAQEWWMIVTTPEGRWMYPAGDGDPDTTERHLAAAMAVHQVPQDWADTPADGYEVQLTLGEPHPKAGGLRHDAPPLEG